MILKVLIKIGIYSFPKAIKFQKERQGFSISILCIYKVVSSFLVFTGIVFMIKYARIGF